MYKVMICDDEPFSVNDLAARLRALGHEVEVTTHPEVCLERAKNERFDLFVLDMSFSPNVPPHLKDGLALARALRKLDSAVNVPIVGITAVHLDWREKALRLGLVNFFEKPLRPGEVTPKLLEILSSRKKARQAMEDWLDQTAGEQWHVVELRLREGKARLQSSLVGGSGPLLAEPLDYRLALKLLSMGFLDQDLFEGLGGKLQQDLFPSEVNVGFHQHRLLAQLAQRPFRLLLNLEDPVWGHFPWELSRYPGGTDSGHWLGGDPRLTCARVAPNTGALLKDEILNGTLRILVVGALPSGVAKLDLSAEVEGLREALLPLGRRVEWRILGPPEINALGEASPDNVKAEISRFKPHFIHFIGHGRKGALILEEEQAIATWAEYFLNLDLAGTEVKLLTLNCCFSGQPDVSSQGAMMAGIRAGVQAAIGHFFPVSDAAAIRFTRLLYEGLARGEVLDRAFQEARRQVTHSELQKQRAFLPILAVRNRFFKLAV